MDQVALQLYSRTMADSSDYALLTGPKEDQAKKGSQAAAGNQLQTYVSLIYNSVQNEAATTKKAGEQRKSGKCQASLEQLATAVVYKPLEMKSIIFVLIWRKPHVWACHHLLRPSPSLWHLLYPASVLPA
jgi:hypothetical protein